MKKFKFITFSLVAVMLFALNFDVVSAAPKSINVKRAEVLSDLVTNHDHGFTIFTTTEGQIIYCLDNLKTRLDSGMSASLSGTADAGVQYILENGYPNKRIMDNGEADKYITQAAIWWYMEETGQGDNKLSNEFKTADKTDIYKLIPTYIKPMVANAKKAKANNTKPSMKATIDGNELSLTSDNKYYESRLISVALTGATNYSVALEGGTKNTVIVGADGNAKSSFNANEKFKVRIPASELTEKITVNIKVSTTGVTKSAKIYKPSDNKYQRVVGLFNDEVSLNEVVKLTAAPNTTTVEVDVPNTSANILMASIAAGVIIIIAGIGIILYRGRKVQNS